MAQIDWVTSFPQVDPCLQERPSYGQSDEGTSVRIPCPDIT